ncbi:cytochrome c [Ruegeria sp. 2205SS24-7]|uniref:c-type cytochrome n=1 Tax=Ruegeria discodermiae TaxID=3064389 RepID=UPI0027427066|nr:cytochrome c [Ruegeria sp. 2205SS24-7]MDP5219130.1 cytochrome c [Ruegeria sp. 2205SS24-7]
MADLARISRIGRLTRALLVTCALVATSAFAAETIDPGALKRLVHQDCGSCHGLTLKGGLGPDLRAQNLQHYDLGVLKGVILDGIPDTAMPGWRPLMSEEEAEWVARYLLEPVQ